MKIRKAGRKVRRYLAAEEKKLHKVEWGFNVVLLTCVGSGLHVLEGPIALCLAVVYLGLLVSDGEVTA